MASHFGLKHNCGTFDVMVLFITKQHNPQCKASSVDYRGIV